MTWLSPDEHAWRTRHEPVARIKQAAAKRSEPKRMPGNGSFVVTPNGYRLAIMHQWTEANGERWATLKVGENQIAVRARESAIPLQAATIAACKGPDCNRTQKANGYCATHNEQLHRQMALAPIRRNCPLGSTKPKPKATCHGPECNRPPLVKGMCATHYQQQYAGKTLTPIGAYKKKANGAKS